MTGPLPHLVVKSTDLELDRAVWPLFNFFSLSCWWRLYEPRRAVGLQWNDCWLSWFAFATGHGPGRCAGSVCWVDGGQLMSGTG